MAKDFSDRTYDDFRAFDAQRMLVYNEHQKTQDETQQALWKQKEGEREELKDAVMLRITELLQGKWYKLDGWYKDHLRLCEDEGHAKKRRENLDKEARINDVIKTALEQYDLDLLHEWEKVRGI